jgi:hypothetical protein
LLRHAVEGSGVAAHQLGGRRAVACTHHLRAVYSGDSNFLGSMSVDLTVIVTL